MSVIDYGEVTHSWQLYQLIKDLLDAYKRNIEEADAVASTDLVTAATYEKNRWVLRWKGETLMLYLVLPDYWKYIEEGRPPTRNSQGGALYPAILEWVKVKKIAPRTNPKAKKVPSTEKQIERMAHAITAKIHNKGYFDPGHHGKHLLQKAIDETNIAVQFANALTDQFNRAIHVELGETFGKNRGN